MTTYRKNKESYTDAAIVYGVYQHNNEKERELMTQVMYQKCKRYFNDHYHALFFVGEDAKKDIFQESFIQLWQNIERQKIYVEDGILKGKNGEEFEGSLTTYLMSIASLKYKEWVRDEAKAHPKGDEVESQDDNKPIPIDTIQDDLHKWILYGNDEQRKLAIISYCISHMSERCCDILSRFFYEEKKYDTILEELPSYVSINALKTEKYKCLQRLKASSEELYEKLSA